MKDVTITVGLLIAIAAGAVVLHNGIQVSRNWLAKVLRWPSLATHSGAVPAPVVPVPVQPVRPAYTPPAITTLPSLPKADKAGNAVPAMDTVLQRIAANDPVTIGSVVAKPDSYTLAEVAAAREYAARLARDSRYGFGPGVNPFLTIAGEAHLLDEPGPVAGQTVYAWLKQVNGMPA